MLENAFSYPYLLPEPHTLSEKRPDSKLKMSHNAAVFADNAVAFIVFDELQKGASCLHQIFATSYGFSIQVLLFLFRNLLT